MLFTFPSRYWFTIGRQGVFRLGGWSPHVQTGFHVPRPTQGSQQDFHIRGYHPLWPDFPDRSATLAQTTGLLRFRSPLLPESRLMSVPPGTEMFQFPGFASTAYVFSCRYLIEVGCPIRTPRDQRLLAAPPRFSQRATSFFASWRQGIHQMPFSYSKPVIPLTEYDQASHRTHPTPSIKPRCQFGPGSAGQTGPIIHTHTHTSSHPRARHSTPTLDTNSRITPKTASRRVALPTPAGATEPDSQSTMNTTNPNQRLRSDLEPRSKPNQTHTPANAPCHGDGRVRTDDPLLAKQVLSQLSYAPKITGPPGSPLHTTAAPASA